MKEDAPQVIEEDLAEWAVMVALRDPQVEPIITREARPPAPSERRRATAALRHSSALLVAIVEAVEIPSRVKNRLRRAERVSAISPYQAEVKV
jgi:hypothetical protein